MKDFFELLQELNDFEIASTAEELRNFKQGKIWNDFKTEMYVNLVNRWEALEKTEDPFDAGVISGNIEAIRRFIHMIDDFIDRAEKRAEED
jgi:hypothetical protein